MEAIVRQYQPNDLDGVMSAWESATKVAHPFLEESFLETERYNIPNVYLPNTDTWVAEVNGDVVGFIALMGNEVGAIFLDPAFHGAGIGRSLMDSGGVRGQRHRAQLLRFLWLHTTGQIPARADRSEGVTPAASQACVASNIRTRLCS